MLKWLKSKTSDKTPDAVTVVADSASPPVHLPQTAKEQGDEHLKANRHADAERCYRQSDGKSGRTMYPSALVNLGFVLREQGRTLEAREVLERATCIADKDADSHYLLASVLEITGTRDAEISCLQTAIGLRPDFDLARRQLMAALFKSGRFTDAATLCDESIKILPESADLHFVRANLHLQSNEKTSAIESCKRALALNPGIPWHPKEDPCRGSRSRPSNSNRQRRRTDGRSNLPLSILARIISSVWCCIERGDMPGRSSISSVR